MHHVRMISNNPKARKLSEEIAKLVKDQRLKQGLSKSKLSEMSGLSRQAILYIETMQRCPSVETMYTLADALGMSLWELIKEAESKVK